MAFKFLRFNEASTVKTSRNIFISVLLALTLNITSIGSASDLPINETRNLLQDASTIHEASDESEWKKSESSYKSLTLYSERVVTPLTLIADSKTETLKDRAMAIRALGDIGSSTSVPFFDKMLTAHEDVIRMEAIGAIAKYGDEHGVNILCKLIASDSGMDAEAAQNALRGISNPRAIEALSAHLKDSNLSIVDAVQSALFNVGSEVALQKLAASLKDARLNVRHHAAELLGKTKSKSALKALTDALNHENASSVRIAIASSMLELGESTTSLKLLWENIQTGNVEDRCQAITGTQYTRDAKTITLLRYLLKDTEPLIRASAVNVLAKIGDESVWVDIKQVADHDEWAQLREDANALIQQKAGSKRGP